MKKKILVIAMAFVIALGVTSCASVERGMKDMKSELSGGLKRTVNATMKILESQ